MLEHLLQTEEQVRQRKHLGAVLLLASPLFGFPLSPLAAQPPAQSVPASAQDLAGDWQATFTGTATAPGDTRIVFRISKAPTGLRAVAFWVDPNHYPVSIPQLTLRGDAVSFPAISLNGSFQGKLAPNGTSITGQWTQGSEPRAGGFATQPLTLTRAARATAWEIAPPLGTPEKLIPATADPTFEVTTVKPHDPNVRGGGWRWIGARRFQATMPVGALLEDIYGLQKQLIVGAPDWLFKDVYDYTGVPDLPGWPTLQQRYNMERKMLEDRFQLKTHMETRDLSGLALTTGKSGSIMTPSILVDPGCTLGMRPAPAGGFLFTARNASIGDFKRFLQQMLDRPVVDHTGLPGQYDFDLTFLPDDSMFGGHLPPVDNTSTPPPGLFTAMQEQLGLKLTPFKGQVEVLVIDHVERPSPN
jgi:uncharacterized protein (TIGR03435 family)